MRRLSAPTVIATVAASAALLVSALSAGPAAAALPTYTVSPISLTGSGVSITDPYGMTLTSGTSPALLISQIDGDIVSVPTAHPAEARYLMASDDSDVAVDGDTAYVTEQTPTPTVGYFNFVTDAAGPEGLTIPDGSSYSLATAYGLAVSPDGKLLYIADAGDRGGSVVLVADVSGDSRNDEVIGELSDPNDDLEDATALAVSPDGRTLYATTGDDVAVADVAGVSLSHPSDGTFTKLIADPNASRTYGVVVSPDGRTLYVADYLARDGGGTTVSVVDVSGDSDDDTVVGTITDPTTAFEAPSGLALAPDGRTLYVVNQGTDDLDAVSIPAASKPSKVRISGRARVGSLLRAAATVPAGEHPSYQWYANGRAIAGATGATLRPAVAALGRRLTVRVTAGAVGWAPSTAVQSASTQKVARGHLTGFTPRIAGRVRVGARLRASIRAWRPAPVTLRFQWYANGRKLRHATTRSLTVMHSLVGESLTVRVTGTKAGYQTLVKRSRTVAG